MRGFIVSPSPPIGGGRGSCFVYDDLTVAPRIIGVCGWGLSLCPLQPKFGQRLFFNGITLRGGIQPVGVCILEVFGGNFSRGSALLGILFGVGDRNWVRCSPLFFIGGGGSTLSLGS